MLHPRKPIIVPAAGIPARGTATAGSSRSPPRFPGSAASWRLRDRSPASSSIALGAPPSFGAGTSLDAVAVGDFNGDGKLDLVAANDGSNNVTIFLGNGDGTFQPAVNYGVGEAPTSVAVGDFNGDGKLDLAVANEPRGSYLQRSPRFRT